MCWRLRSTTSQSKDEWNFSHISWLDRDRERHHGYYPISLRNYSKWSNPENPIKAIPIHRSNHMAEGLQHLHFWTQPGFTEFHDQGRKGFVLCHTTLCERQELWFTQEIVKDSPDWSIFINTSQLHWKLATRRAWDSPTASRTRWNLWSFL